MNGSIKMFVDRIKEDLEKHDLLYRGLCHDCGTQVEVSITVNEEGESVISGGAMYRIKQGFGEKELFFKCDSCFAEDPILRNFRRTEVYSRAIGYLRPVNQWNKGKLEEFKMRKTFVNMEKH